MYLSFGIARVCFLHLFGDFNNSGKKSFPREQPNQNKKGEKSDPGFIESVYEIQSNLY